MSKVKRKPARAVLCLVLAFVVAFAFLLATSAVFADTMQPGDYKVKSSFTVHRDFIRRPTKVTGTVDLDKTISVPKASLNNGKYTGTVNCSVEAADLFEGAYQVYKNSFKGKSYSLGHKWENIVMFDEGGKYPTAQYTIQFPSYVHVDDNAVTTTENTSTISDISHKYNAKDNSVTITMKLGNWNDYKGFFELFESEQGQSGHPINVSIPYSVDEKDLTGVSSDSLGTIKGSGTCCLYKCSGIGQGEIVHITTTGAGSMSLTR